jgi:hypothetical protein
MGSIVAGSTYLIAPPPPKSFKHHHLLASILCRPLRKSVLLLQLQRKDKDARHALPQFDLVCRRAGRGSRNGNDTDLSRAPGCHPQEVAIQHSENGENIATVKYLSQLNSAQRRRAGIAPDDTTVIGAIYWKYTPSITKVWTIHRYEAKKKGTKVIGYEFRLATELVRGKAGYVYIRWTQKVSPLMQDRPQSVASRRRRSSSVSSSDTPRRQNTFPTSPTKPSTPTERKWEFSSPNVRRILGSMTSQKLHIHSISSTGTPLSSPSSSDFDEELHSDRELTTGRMFEMLVVTGLFVGLEDDFASKLRKEFLSAGGLRIPTSDDITDKTVETGTSPPRRPRLTPLSSTTTPVEEQPNPVFANEIVESPLETNAPPPKSMALLATQLPNIPATSLASRGWGYMSGAAAACLTKIMSLAA